MGKLIRNNKVMQCNNFGPNGTKASKGNGCPRKGNRWPCKGNGNPPPTYSDPPPLYKLHFQANSEPDSSFLLPPRPASEQERSVLWHDSITKLIPWELFFVIFEGISTLKIWGKERLFHGITREIHNFENYYYCFSYCYCVQVGVSKQHLRVCSFNLSYPISLHVEWNINPQNMNFSQVQVCTFEGVSLHSFHIQCLRH